MYVVLILTVVLTAILKWYQNESTEEWGDLPENPQLLSSGACGTRAENFRLHALALSFLVAAFLFWRKCTVLTMLFLSLSDINKSILTNLWKPVVCQAVCWAWCPGEGRGTCDLCTAVRSWISNWHFIYWIPLWWYCTNRWHREELWGNESWHLSSSRVCQVLG